jgi:hypothetical protein
MFRENMCTRFLLFLWFLLMLVALRMPLPAGPENLPGG